MKQNCLGIEPYTENNIVEGINFDKDDILIANIRPYLKKAWLASFSGICSADVLVIHPMNVDSAFLYSAISRDSFFTYVMSGVKGSKMPRGDKSHIMDFPLAIPTIDEQQKIASFLTLLDKRIAKQRELVERLKSYKRGLLSAIFSRKIRFKDKEGNPFSDWIKCTIGSIFSERCERANGDEDLLAVTINSGIIKREEIELKDNSSDDKSNYKSVHVNDIAYNTMRMWQGASGISAYDGIVSPAYTVIYATNAHNTDVRFWGYYFKTYSLICEFQRYSQGLTSDTWNLKYPQLAEIEVDIPCIEEQRTIADFFDTLNEAILQHERYLNFLTIQRNELLRKMFI